MLALRLARSARPAVQFRRLLVAAASAGTGFLLLCTLGYALGHPDASGPAALRLAWCVAPLAATVQFAVAVARTDPATRPRPGLAAIGLGPGRMMVLAAVSTAVSCTLGSMVALLFFLHLRGDLTGLPFDGDAADLLAADESLPLPAALTLLALVPIAASVASAVVLRPRGTKPIGLVPGGRPGRLSGFGGYGRSAERIGLGAYGRFGARGGGKSDGASGGANGTGRNSNGPDTHGASGRGGAPGRDGTSGRAGASESVSGREGSGDGDERGARAGRDEDSGAEARGRVAALDVPRRSGARAGTGARAGADADAEAGTAARTDTDAVAGADAGTGSGTATGTGTSTGPGTGTGTGTGANGHPGGRGRSAGRKPSGAGTASGTHAQDGPGAHDRHGTAHRPGTPGTPDGPERADHVDRAQYSGLPHHPGRPGHPLDPQHPPAPLPTPGGLPWGAAVLAAGLAVETYAGRTSPSLDGPALPGGFAGGPLGVLVGWALTAVGLALAGPAITHLCGRLLQAVRPGALRLLAGRVLMEEASRIGRPLGVVCAVASGAYAMAVLYTGARPDVGPLTTLGALLVAGCAVATLLTAAVEARNARADTTQALLRLGAPATTLRGAATLRAGALLAVFGPLTWAVAELAALPPAH